LKASALIISGGPFFVSHREQLAALTLRHAMPAVFPYREFAAAGGLMSYGSDISDSYRLAGVYTGRILKGDKPAELPVQQADEVELYIKDRQDARHHRPQHVDWARRRGLRMRKHDVRYWHLADIVRGSI
jgi:hypothetical protein